VVSLEIPTPRCNYEVDIEDFARWFSKEDLSNSRKQLLDWEFQMTNVKLK
jgi:hypothetical protein